MTDPHVTLQLHLDDGKPVPIQIRRESRERSHHSGRDLRELHGCVVTDDIQLHERLTGLLPDVADIPIKAVDEVGDFAGKWTVSWNSYAESGGVHNYTLILREAEELNLEVLQIDGLEIHPYEYREEVVGEGLTVWAKVVGTEQDVLRLRALVQERRSFPVVRQGIQNEPRQMQLGVAEWSAYEDRIKYRLVLVDQGLDISNRPDLSRIEAENSRVALGFYASFLERLAERLVEKGVFSQEEVTELRDLAHRGPGVSRHELWRVADIDEV